MRRPNLKDKINDNTCNFKVHIIEDDHVPVQQPSQSEIVQSTTPAANITDTCNINSDREYEIHNLLDRMEDPRQDILKITKISSFFLGLFALLWRLKTF
jgi:hypothetical protein